jgi:outer membrane protein TolC
MRADLDEEKHEIMAMLTNIVGEASNVPPPSVQARAWDDNVETTYPVMVAGEDIAAAHQDVGLRESEFNPGLEVQAGYGRMNGGDNAATVMVGVTIPLWASQSQMPKLNGAKSSLRAAETDQDNVRRQILQKLSHLRAQINASDKKLEVLEYKLSLLKSSSGAQTREYEAGKTDLSMPLKTRRDMVSVRYQQAAERAKRIALIADFNHYFIEGEK